MTRQDQPVRLGRSGAAARTASLSSFATLRAIALACAAALAFAATPRGAMAQSQPGAAAVPLELALPAQPLAQTLNVLSRQSGVAIGADSALLAGKTAPALRGSLTLRQALERVLAGSGLIGSFSGGTITVQPAPLQPQGLEHMPVTVKAAHVRDATTEGSRSYAASSASIMKGVALLKEIPQTVSIITRQRIEDQGLDTLEKIMETAPGIYKESNRGGISGKDSDGTYYSRGYMITSYMLDGVAVNGQFTPNDGTPTSMISGSSAIYDRAEILRGAAGLLVGAGQPGGTVNLVRKRPTEEFQQRYLASVGSWDSQHFQADISGPVNEAGTLRARLVADYDKSGRHWKYAGTASEAPLVYGIVEWSASPGTRIGLGGRYEKYREKESPRAVFQPDWGYKYSWEKEVFLDLKHDVNEKWQVNAMVAHKEYDLDFLTAVVFNEFDSNWRGDVQARQHRFKTDSLDVNLLGKFDAFGREHRLTVGFNGSDERVRPRTSGTLTLPRDQFPFDPYNYSHGIWPSLDSDLVQNLIRKTRNGPSWLDTRSYGGYGKLEAKLLDSLTAVMGARASQHRVDGSNAAGVRQTYASDEVSAVTPYAGLVYAISPQWSAYASYADIFRPQFDKWTRDGKLVDHVVGANYEVGVKGELLGGRLNAALALFRVDEKNSTMAEVKPYDELCPGNPRYPELGACVIATGHKRSQGIDAEISGELLRNWQVSAGYTYLTSKVLKSDLGAGGPIVGWRGSSGPVTPRHMLKLFSSYRFRGGVLDGLTVGGGGTLQSEQVFYSSVSTDAKWTQGGRAVWDVFARYEIDRNVSLGLNVSNAFDKQYFLYAPPSVIRNDSIYGAPREVKLSLAARF